MTREEAIKFGERVISLGLNDETQAFCEFVVKVLKEPCGDATSRQTVKDLYYKNEFWMAFDMAIESLGQEPCEDAISRENLLLWLDDIKESARKHVGFLLDVQRYIRSMSPVTPQPKTGYWIVEVWNNKEHHTCSSCQHVVDYEPCYHYCPYCGAKMKESEG